MNSELNRIEFEELEDRFEMAAAAGGKCERKCSGGDSESGDGGDGPIIVNQPSPEPEPQPQPEPTDPIPS